MVFKGSCLKQTKNAAYTTHNNRIFVFILYELDSWSCDLNSDFTLKDYVFGSVKLDKTGDPDK